MDRIDGFFILEKLNSKNESLPFTALKVSASRFIPFLLTDQKRVRLRCDSLRLIVPVAFAQGLRSGRQARLRLGVCHPSR